MPGNNELVLCLSALREIVEGHLNATQGKTSHPRVNVTNVVLDTQSHVVRFTLTTDEVKT